MDEQGCGSGRLRRSRELRAIRRCDSASARSPTRLDHAATPQVRNVATIGGNLLQRPRCWYFRSEHFLNEFVDVRWRSTARISTTAFSTIRNRSCTRPRRRRRCWRTTRRFTCGPARRTQHSDQRFLAARRTPPRANDAAMTRRSADAHHCAAPPAGTRAAYHKQTERDSYDWPICDVAVVLHSGDLIEAASIALGWVAPTPRRATNSEQRLTGRRIDATTAAEAARVAIEGATPLSRNAYKVQLLEVVVRRTILAAAGSSATA